MPPNGTEAEEKVKECAKKETTQNGVKDIGSSEYNRIFSSSTAQAKVACRPIYSALAAAKQSPARFYRFSDDRIAKYLSLIHI